MSNDLKVQKTFTIGETVRVSWSTHSSYESEDEYGVIVGAYVNSKNVLHYMVRIDGETKEVPHYQINS